MAERGKPLPWEKREEIKRLALLERSQRQIAKEVGVCRKTVEKYLQKLFSKCRPNLSTSTTASA